MSLTKSSVDRWSAEIAEVGYSVAAAVFTPSEVAKLRGALDETLQREEAIAADRGWANDIYRVAYMLPAKSPEFLRVCWHPVLLDLVRSVLGHACVLASLNGFTTTPGGQAQRLHQDQESPLPTMTIHVNAVCVLDAFTVDNGATRVVPGSHRWRADRAESEALERRAVTVEAEPGSVLGYSGALWHASGENRTSSSRRTLHAFFTRPGIVPHWDFPASIPGPVAATLTDDQRRLLGFDSRPRRYDLETDRISR